MQKSVRKGWGLFRVLVVLLLCVAAWPMPAAAQQGGEFRREFAALDEAFTILQEVRDEESAKRAVTKLRARFATLPPPTKGNEQELLEWARKQNRVSEIMWRLRKEPYWEKLRMQEIWSLISDPFSRPGLPH